MRLKLGIFVARTFELLDPVLGSVYGHRYSFLLAPLLPGALPSPISSQTPEILRGLRLSKPEVLGTTPGSLFRRLTPMIPLRVSSISRRHRQADSPYVAESDEAYLRLHTLTGPTVVGDDRQGTDRRAGRADELKWCTHEVE